jgi:hypothetical protein
MKKIMIVVLTLLVVSALFANGILSRQNASQAKASRYEVVAYHEDFESGGTGWTHYDGAESPNNWHIYNDVSAPAQGNVWWMGDPALAVGANIGGYYDHQYLVLDTPQILVPTATPTLTFKLKYNVEGTAGATAPYNGWDACNVRISTNNGATWTPISGTPAYNMTSSYAFGFEHGEGPNIPGWGGSSNGWQNASFSLASYAGQNVKIRFAFASDPAYSTGDAPAMFGMMVDDIALGSYTNNGVNDGQMTWTSLVPLGGDLWHLTTVADAPSPTHAYVCQNAQGSYNPNMMNYLVSPAIDLPASGDIRADFMIKGNFTDPNTFPAVDYFGWEISVNNGITWFAMSNPYNSPTGSSYVYSDAPPSWASMCESYSLDGYISDYAGQTAIFRWYFRSDEDTPQGTGIMIDDFKIYNDIFLAEPSNMAAVVAGSNVELSWSNPGGGGTEGWLHYDSGTNADGIGLQVGGNLEVAAKWAPSGPNSILPYVGMNITQVKFWPNQAGINYTVKIYTGASGNEVYSQAVTNPTIGAWNTVTLNTPFEIPSGTYVWVGYLCPHTAGQYPAGNDDGPAVAGFGDLYRVGSGWSSLYDASAGEYDANWNIQAYVADAAGNPVQIAPANLRDRDITAFKIYKDNAYLATVAQDVFTYTDTNVAGGLHTYYVTAMYGTNESLASNVATVYVLPTGYAEIEYNDGTPEQGYTVGSSNSMAVKFVHNYEATIKFVKIYVASVGNSPMIIRIFDDNGPGGLPGANHLTQFTYAATSIVQGWNYIPVPTGSDITIMDGSFYIALYEYSNASTIGLDTNNNGQSYTRTAAGWAPLTLGELMIHAIVQNGGVGADDNVVAPIVFAASNYPNPFNPVTSISYSVPKDGQATLAIYNMKGQVVRTLLNSSVKAGNYSVSWNGTDDKGIAVASGVYFYRLTSDNKTITKKMLLSK